MSATLIIPFLLVGLYGWLSAIGFGLSLLRLLPRATLVKQALRLALPIWGLGNIFLVVTILALAIFFGGNTNGIFHIVLPAVAWALSLALAQSVLVIGLFYSNAKTGFRNSNILYALLSFLVPLVLSLAGIRLVTGGQFWQSGLGWVLLLSLALGLVTLAVAFMFYIVGHTPHDRLHQLSRWLNLSLATFVATGLTLSLSSKIKHFHMTALPLFVAAAVGIGVVELLLAVLKRERYSWWYLSLFAVATPVLLAITDHVNLLALRQ